MQLTKQTDFAFRTLIFLTQLKEGELAQIKQICDFYDISQNHLSKVVVTLAKLGYIESLRGKGGGIRLAKPAADINLADVVKQVEPSLKVVNCSEPACAIQANCDLQGILAKATEAFVGVLAQHTLADLMKPALRQQFEGASASLQVLKFEA